MGDKKKFLNDLLTSETVSSFFQELLDKQTNSLITYIENIEEKKQNKELSSLREKYQNEMARNQQLEEKLKEIEINVDDLEQKIKMLEDENADLEKKLDNKVQQAEALEQKNRQLEMQMREMFDNQNNEIQWLKEKADQTDKKLRSYEEKYQDMEAAYGCYMELSQDAKNRLCNIFESSSIYGIVAACSDWRNIEGLWDFAKRRIIEKEKKDADSLVSLFEFLFYAYNLKGNERKYELIRPMLGEKFDSDEHMIIGILTDGFVADVKLPGIRDIKSKRVLQRACIEVRKEKL